MIHSAPIRTFEFSAAASCFVACVSQYLIAFSANLATLATMSSSSNLDDRAIDALLKKMEARRGELSKEQLDASSRQVSKRDVDEMKAGEPFKNDGNGKENNGPSSPPGKRGSFRESTPGTTSLYPSAQLDEMR